MYIEKATFLGITAALAAGGVGGYLYHAASTAHQQPEPQAPVPVATPEKSDASDRNDASEHKIVANAPPAAPACDDNVGAPEECPVAVSSTDEGVCGGGIYWAARRCADFKTALKPKVAQAAVACIKSLKGNESCDEKRVNLCGHEALMMACQEELPATRADVTSMNLGSAPPLPSGASSVATQCESIVKDCAGGAPGASYADCVRTLSGMTDSGRAATATCMKTHCSDKGLMGCEAAVEVKTALAE